MEEVGNWVCGFVPDPSSVHCSGASWVDPLQGPK
jgi:hypothetical protein